MGQLPIILGNILVRINQNWQRLMPRKIKTHILGTNSLLMRQPSLILGNIFLRINEN